MSRYTDDPVADCSGGKKTRMDITGCTFGRLAVLSFSHTNKHGQSTWLCRCECGNETLVAGIHLKSGHTTSCGCFRDELSGNRIRTHGKRQTRMYRIWLGMKARCTMPNTKTYSHYGGRGISICAEWSDNFMSFYEWSVANGYSDELTIDRIDANGNYCPDNCRWVPWEKQNNNKRTNVYIESNGERHTLKEWSEITGIPYTTIHGRYKSGKKINEILHKGSLQATERMCC